MNDHARARVGRVRRWPAIAALCFASVACLHQDTNSGVIIHPTLKATATPIAPGIFAVGQTVGRPNGNTIAVLGYAGPFPARQSGILVVAADVEACVNPQAPREVSFTSRTFDIELSDKTRRPSTSGDRRTPEFGTQTLKPGRCGRGWVHFEFRNDEKPASIVYAVTPPIRWNVS